LSSVFDSTRIHVLCIMEAYMYNGLYIQTTSTTLKLRYKAINMQLGTSATYLNLLTD